MKTNKWIVADDTFTGKPTPRSGGDKTQLKGFDGRDRVIAQPNGVNRTPDIISRPGKHVPKARESKATPTTMPSVNDGPGFRSGPELRLDWEKKGYLKSKRGK